MRIQIRPTLRPVKSYTHVLYVHESCKSNYLFLDDKRLLLAANLEGQSSNEDTSSYLDSKNKGPFSRFRVLESKSREIHAFMITTVRLEHEYNAHVPFAAAGPYGTVWDMHAVDRRSADMDIDAV